MAVGAPDSGRQAHALAGEAGLGKSQLAIAMAAAQKIAELGHVRLVVIDPISSYLGPKINSHVNAAVRSVLEPIGGMG